MIEEKNINDRKALYISGYGDDSNETIVYALTMPVVVAVHIDHNGEGVVEFYETTEGDVKLPVCQTGFIRRR